MTNERDVFIEGNIGIEGNTEELDIVGERNRDIRDIDAGDVVQRRIALDCSKKDSIGFVGILMLAHCMQTRSSETGSTD